MNKLLLCLFGLLCFSLKTEAQPPQSIPFQGVARNASGIPLPNQTISVQLTVHNLTSSGVVVYQEKFVGVLTNSLGLFTVAVGQGSVVSGNFGAIPWAVGNKFLEIGYDPTGGSSFTSLGATQMLSVPYALYAGSAGGSDSGWALSGNAGTDAGTNFIGTTDAAALSIRTKGMEAIHIDNSQNVGVGTSAPISNLSLRGTNDFQWVASDIFGYNTGMNAMSVDLNLSSIWGATTYTNSQNNSIKFSGTALFNHDNFYIGTVEDPQQAFSSTSKAAIFGDPNSQFLSVDSNDFIFWTKYFGPGALTITSMSDVGVGTTTPGSLFEVAGSAYFADTTYHGALSIGASTSQPTTDFQLQDGTQTAGYVLTSDVNGNANWQPNGGGAGWSLTGNAGTTPGTNFIGTTDGSALVMEANNTVSGYIDISTGNTIFGYNAYPNIYPGVYGYNTAIGSQALFSEVTGNENTVVGQSVLYNDVSGQGNTVIGSYGFVSNYTGSYLTGIGYAVDVMADGLTNATAIGYGTLIGQSNTVVLGNNGGTPVNVGIGTSYPGSLLEVAGSAYFADTTYHGAISIGANTSQPTTDFQLQDGTQVAGYVLTSDANGNGNWQPGAAWGLTGNAGTDPLTNFIGTTDAVPLMMEVNNIPAGYLGINSGGSYRDVAFGSGALLTSIVADNDGQGNTAIGSSSLTLVNGGVENTAIGYGSGASNISGDFNTFLGYGADISGDGFINSTAIGAGSLITGFNQMVFGNGVSSWVVNNVSWQMPANNSLGMLTNDGSGNLSWQLPGDTLTVVTRDTSIIFTDSFPDIGNTWHVHGSIDCQDSVNAATLHANNLVGGGYVGADVNGNLKLITLPLSATFLGTPAKDSLVTGFNVVNFTANYSYVITADTTMSYVVLVFPVGTTGQYIVVNFNVNLTSIINAGSGFATVSSNDIAAGTTKIYMNIGGNWY